MSQSNIAQIHQGILTIGDLPTGGPICTAAQLRGITQIIHTQTTAGQTFSIPGYPDAGEARVFQYENAGILVNNFGALGSFQPLSNNGLVWDGTAFSVDSLGAVEQPATQATATGVTVTGRVISAASPAMTTATVWTIPGNAVSALKYVVVGNQQLLAVNGDITLTQNSGTTSSTFTINDAGNVPVVGMSSPPVAVFKR